jgi:hypothetical protein
LESTTATSGISNTIERGDHPLSCLLVRNGKGDAHRELVIDAYFNGIATVQNPAGSNLPQQPTLKFANGTVANDDGVTVYTAPTAASGSGQQTNALVNGLNSNIPTGGLGSLRFGSYTAAVIIGGFLLPGGATPAAGQVIQLEGLVTGQNVSIANNDTNSAHGVAGGYPILTGTGTAVLLPPGQAPKCYIQFDGTLAAWKLMSTGATSIVAYQAQNFAVVADGATDNTGNLQSAMNFCAEVGARLELPPTGVILCSSGSLAIPSNLRMTGSFAQSATGDLAHGTQLKFTGAGDGFTVANGIYDWSIEHVQMIQGPSAGPLIQIAAGASTSFKMRHFAMYLENPAVEGILGGTSGSSPVGCQASQCLIEDFTVQLWASSAKQAIALYGAGGGLNNIRIRDFQINGPGLVSVPTAEFIRVENVDGSLTTNIVIEHCNIEGPVAGAIAMLSVSRSRVSDMWAGDLSSTSPTAPLIKTGKSAHGTALASGMNTFTDVQTDIGSSGTYASLLIDGSTDQGTTCIGCKLPYVDNGQGSGAASGVTITAINSVIGGYNGQNRPTGIYSGALVGTAVLKAHDTAAVSNGLNSNLVNANLLVPSVLRLGGNTGAFSIDSIDTAMFDGLDLDLVNPSIYPMTLVDASETGSRTGWKIQTMRETNIVVPGPGRARLQGSYADSTFQVVSVSPDGFFYPTEIPGCVALFDARLSANTVGTEIASMSSVVGTLVAAQATGSAQPTLVANDSSYNKDTTLSFAEASSQTLVCSASLSPALGTAYTAIVVGNIASAIGSNQSFYGDSSGSTLSELYAATTTGLLSAYGGTALATTTVPTSPTVMAVTWDGSSTSIYVNNSQVAAATGAAGTGGLTTIDLGSSNSGNFLGGKGAFWGFWNRILSSSELADIFEYLGQRYGIAAS